MKPIIDSLARVSPILAAIASLFYFGFPLSSWADQFGPTVGNFSLALAGLLLLALVFLGIDRLMSYFRLSGWKLVILKNGLRIILLFMISLPLIGFNVNPTITIAYTHAHPYEVGKNLGIELYLRNTNTSEKWVRGMYQTNLVTRGNESRQALEDRLWASLMTIKEKSYIEFPVALPKMNPHALMEGPILTSELVNGLKDKTTVVYFMGVILYYEWYGLPRRVEFCGSYMDDSRFMIMCDKHSEGFSSSPRLR